MNQFLLGRLSAIVQSLDIEVAFLAEQDEDANGRLKKFVEKLQDVSMELLAENPPPVNPAAICIKPC